MKRWLLVFALWVGLAAPGAHAQAPGGCPPQATPPSAEQVAEARASARDRGFLWRVTKDGRSSHLYGTLHLGRFAWTLPGPKVAAALAASDVVGLELDLEDAALMQRLRDGMAAQRGTALPAELDARLRRQLAEACLPAALLDIMSPEMAATTLVVMSARNVGLDPAWGIDPALGRAARALGKPVLSFETPELQLALLASTSAEAAREVVQRALDDLDADHTRPMLLRMARVWAEGQHEQLARYGEWCDCLRDERERAQMALIVDARNPALADAVDALHRDGRRVFAAVGSLHMIGPAGLPALLAARGYTVEQVAFDTVR